MWSLRNVYLYLVCFVSIVLIISGLITFLSSMVDIFIDTSYYPSAIEIQTQYSKDSNIPKDELITQQARINEQNRTSERNRKINNCLKSLSMFLVALPFYLYHWKKIESWNTKQTETQVSV